MFDENLAYDTSCIFRVQCFRDGKSILIFIKSLVQLCNFIDLEFNNFEKIEVVDLSLNNDFDDIFQYVKED